MNAALVITFILSLALVIVFLRTRNPHHKSIKAMATTAAQQDFYFKRVKYYYSNDTSIETYALVYDKAYDKAYAKAIKYGVN